MTDIRRILSESNGVPVRLFFERGLVRESVRALLSDQAGSVMVHYGKAAQLALAHLQSHACCLNRSVFLGASIDSAAGPTLSEALEHELVHVAQVAVGQRTARTATLPDIEREAVAFTQNAPPLTSIQQGASPEEIYHFWWLIPLAAAAYVLLRPNIANAPEPGGKTYPSVSEARVAGEALALFAVPEASLGITGRIGLGYFGRLAFAGASATMSYRAVGDISDGEFSGVQTYVIDGFTGAIIGVVVPGGIKLIGSGVTVSLDSLATWGMRQSDFAIARAISQRAATAPVTADELANLFSSRGMTGRMAESWLNRRGLIILYRGQGIQTLGMLSPIGRSSGLSASEALVQRMRAAGLSDGEIAGYTGMWHNNPVPPALAPPGLGGQPLGAAGIPTTRIPGVAANFPKGGVVYVIRMPRGSVIQVPPWGLSLENEWIVLNQIPRSAIVDAIPATSLPALEVNEAGLLIPGTRGGFGAPTLNSGPLRLPQLMSPRLPLFGLPPLSSPQKKIPPPNPPGAGTVTEQTTCVRPNSDYLNPICTTQKTYIVKNGDSLWALAARFYGDGKQYTKLYEANKATLGPQIAKPRLVPGQTLVLP